MFFGFRPGNVSICRRRSESAKSDFLYFLRSQSRQTYTHAHTHTWHIDDQSLRMEGDNRNRIPSNTQGTGTHTLRSLSERVFAIYSWAKTLSILFSLLLSCFGKPFIYYDLFNFITISIHEKIPKWKLFRRKKRTRNWNARIFWKIISIDFW